MTEEDLTIRTDEDLTAYLDGELSPELSRQVEDRLATDSLYRSRLQELQKTWDLLDQLPRTSGVNEKFTRTTMELAVQTTAGDVRKKKSRRLGWLLPAALMVFLPVAGFFSASEITRQVQSAPQRQLMADLEVIENVDLYKTIGSLDFIEALSGMLRDNQLDFGFDAESDMPSSWPATQLVSNNSGLESYNNDQLDEVRRNKRAFEQLSETERQQLRDLHQKLVTHERRTELESVMADYYSWLRTIEPGDMRNLLDLPPDQRIEAIHQNRVQQIREVAGYLPMDDVEIVHNWARRVMEYEKDQIKAHWETEAFGNRLIEFLQDNKDVVTVGDFEFIGRVDPDFAGDILFKHIMELRYGLSYSGLAALEDRDQAEQKELVIKWVIAAIQAKRTVTMNQLKSFYRSLDDRMRARLDEKSPEERDRELLKLYRQQQLRQRNFNQLNQRPYSNRAAPEG